MQKLGDSIKASPPNINQNASNGGGWTRYENANMTGMVPARAMCFNVPLELFSNDASSFKDWQTPADNNIRAASIAALVGMVYTPLSKGMVSGMHEENARMKDAEDPQNKDDKDKKSIKPVESVKWYQMQHPTDKTTNIPMLLMGVEDVYNANKTSVLALRLLALCVRPHPLHVRARSQADERELRGVCALWIRALPEREAPRLCGDRCKGYPNLARHISRLRQA